MGITFLASVIHLGSPLRAFNSLNRIGASTLGNEIASGSLSFIAGDLWWLVAFLGKMPAALGKIWILLSMLLGLVSVFAMTSVYQIDAVPIQYNGYTTLALLMTMLFSGSLFAALLLCVAGISFNTTRFTGISVLTLLVTTVVIVLQRLSLDEIHSSVQSVNALAPDYDSLQVWRVLLLTAGLDCWICPLIRCKGLSINELALGLTLMLADEIIGHGLFYGLHMTVETAVAGQFSGAGQPALFRIACITHFSQRDSLSTAARVLDALFYYTPDSAEASTLVSALRIDGWQAQWPLEKTTLSSLAVQFQTEADESLPQVQQRLFVGPYALPSPFWGSVRLDRENVLFGDSTLTLRQWIRDNDVQFTMQQDESESHFGSLLLLTAWLAEDERHIECEQLLAWHLFPWSSRFSNVFIEKADHPFYQALGELVRLTLVQW